MIFDNMPELHFKTGYYWEPLAHALLTGFGDDVWVLKLNAGGKPRDHGWLVQRNIQQNVVESTINPDSSCGIIRNLS